MSSFAVSPSIAEVKPTYQPKTSEAQRALDAVLRANPDEHLCCYDHSPDVAEIGYWRRGAGLLGPNHFVTLGSGSTMDEAVLAAARKITHPLILVEKPTAAQMQMRELVELCAQVMCPLCAGRLNAQADGQIEVNPRLDGNTPEIPIYWHHFVGTGKHARTCVATLLRSQAELFIVSRTASK